MKLVFIDQRGCDAALVAAYYQTGKISGQPSKQEILRLPAFAEQRDRCLGVLRQIGLDADRNSVYTLGVGTEAKIMQVSARELLRLYGAEQDIKVIDLSAYNSFGQKFCWYLGLIPAFKTMGRQISAGLLAQKVPEMIAFLGSELTTAGLEYSGIGKIS